MKQMKNHQTWSWIIMIAFISLSIVDIRFGLLGFLCMGAPLYLALRGKGKVHCARYCPRGSLLGKFLNRISMRTSMPASWRSKHVKHALLIWMLAMFTFALSRAVQQPDVLQAVAYAIFRMMMVSLSVGLLMGVIFNPRSWCQVCPMGHGTALITQAQAKSKRAVPASKGKPAA